jgi:uncharacterized protein
MSLTILLHSSKTMVVTPPQRPLSTPLFSDKADRLSDYVGSLPAKSIISSMHVSEKLAGEVRQLYEERQHHPLSATVDCFRGDIYSGLRALEWNEVERAFATDHLRIVSGLYGLLRPYDGVQPYRLEAAYSFPDEPYQNLYRWWGNELADTLQPGDIINLLSQEYAKLVIPYVKDRSIVSPIFLSRMPNKPEPVFVAVHAKIARGAFARWLVQRGDDSIEGLEAFDDLGYRYDVGRSTSSEPVFICDEFKGIGLSQRLVKP